MTEKRLSFRTKREIFPLSFTFRGVTTRSLAVPSRKEKVRDDMLYRLDVTVLLDSLDFCFFVSRQRRSKERIHVSIHLRYGEFHFIPTFLFIRVIADSQAVEKSRPIVLSQLISGWFLTYFKISSCLGDR
jgi:dipeptide/tripeptide permease